MTGKGYWAQPADLHQVSAEELFNFGPVVLFGNSLDRCCVVLP
jgi:hypothetical protein